MTVKSLSSELVLDGLSQAQADVLEISFGTETDFVAGMNAVVTFLAMEETPDYAPPRANPWCDIWDEMQRDPAQKEIAFQGVILKFPDDIRDILQDVVATKTQNKKLWLSQLGTGPNHNKTPEFYKSILSHLGYQFRYNRCTQNIETNGKPINDFIAAGIRAKARAAGVKEMSAVEDVYEMWAWEQKYHPIQRYLERLKFDGGEPISDLCGYFTDDRNCFEQFLRRWLIGACARAFQGCRNRVFVLDGTQKIGKSFFVRWLGSPMAEYFREGPILPDDKDCRLSLLSTWVWEISEWGTVARRADREALKAFLTTIQIKDRAAYGRFQTTGQAMSNFIATANNEMGLFNDPTGTSRFMTAHITAIDFNYAKQIDIDQVWAQAMDLYINGEQWDLSDAETALAQEINNDYQMIDIVEETIQQLFSIEPGNKVLWMSSLEIMDALKNTGGLKAGIEIDMRKMASALTKLGLEKPKQKRVAGKVERGYAGIRLLP